MSAKTTCPGCGGKKTSRARLCATCRKRANVVGERDWIETGRPSIPSTPRTPQQNRVYHGKLNSIAKLEELPLKDVKRWARERASAMFGRPIESSTELTELEMELLLEAFDRLLDELEASAPAAAQ